MSLRSKNAAHSPPPSSDKASRKLLTVKDLHVRYATERGPVRSADGVSFGIAAGEIFGLAGESGSGKSTIAQAILRILRPPAVITGGQVLFNDQDVLEMNQASLERFRWREVSMVFQSAMNALNPVMTIGEQIGDVLKAHKNMPRREARARAAYIFDLVGIDPGRLENYPHQLSGGMRQRVAIALALAVDPTVILADEPISMLDVSIRMGVLNLMARLKEEHGIGYLYITHDIASARYIGDRTIVMYAGHMVEGAESEALMREPAHPYTQLLLSAVPNPHAGLKRYQTEARGEIPSLIDPPPGCPFAARCPKVMDVCRQVMPGAEWVGAEHWVRCHLYGSGEHATPLEEPRTV